MALASFDGLCYWYPGVPAAALDLLRLELGEGLTLLGGPSGGGKSTLLRTLNGLVPHFHGGRVAGSAIVGGRDLLRTAPSLLSRSVGFVFQDPERQFVYQTVAADVAFGLENVGLPRAEMGPRVDAALESVGALGLRDRRLSTLSGGERQRIALAGALALRPPLVALDEPTSQLDEEGAQSLAGALDSLRADGVSLVVAEHRRDLFEHRADRCLEVEHGRVREGAGDARSSPRGHHREPVGGLAWRLAGGDAGHDRAILKGLDLEGREGEVVAMTGLNGSGKTTLLRVIAGLLKPLRGDVQRPSGRIAYLPQDPGTLLHQPTLRREVELTLRRSGGGHSRPSAVPDAEPFLAEMGLAELAERYPRDLSGGERQRAAIAAVIAGSPALALLDEPTRGMDAAARDRLIAAVDRVASGGGAVIIATHDRELAAAVADRVVSLDR